MATFTQNLRTTKIATGDETGTWGATTNTTYDHLDHAFGYITHAMADGNETITVSDGAASDGRYMVIQITGAWTANRTLTLAPNTMAKMWIIINATTGGFSIVCSQGSGANVTIAAGDSAIIYGDGAGAGAAMVNALDSMAFTNVAGTVTTATQGTINHDSLASYVADEHVAHTGVTLTAGVGLTGGGTIAANRTFTLAVDELAEKTGALVGTDRLTGTTSTTNWSETISGIPLSIFNNDVGWTTAAGDITRVNITAGNGLTGTVNTASGDHTQTIDVVGTASRINTAGGNVDIDIAYVGQTSITTLGTITTGTWTGTSIATANTDAKVVTVTAGVGLSGGGAGSPTLTLDLNELSAGGTPITTDDVAFVDGTLTRKAAFSTIPLSIMSNAVSGFTTNVGTVTSVGGGTGVLSSGGATPSISLAVNELAEKSGAVVGTDRLVGTTGSTNWAETISGIPLSIFSNDSSFSSTVGTVTTVTAGTGMSGGGSPTPTLTLDVNDLAVGGTLVAGDWLIASNATVSNRQLISAIPLSIFNNDLGGGTGTVTNVATGAGLTGGPITTTGTLTADFNSLSASGTLLGTDDLCSIDGSASRKTQISTIPLSIFSNNLGWTTNVGTVTSVSGGDGLSGTVTTSGSLAVDTTVVRTTGNQTLAGTKTFSSTISGSINGSSASTTGNAATATNIAASGLTGSTLAAVVTASSLTSVGTLSSLTISGNLSVGGQAYSPYVDKGTGTGSVTINMNDGNLQHLNNSGSRTVTLSNPNNGGSYCLTIEAITNAVASWTWSTTVEWVNGVAPPLSTTVGWRDTVLLLYADSTWYGNYSIGHR